MDQSAIISVIIDCGGDGRVVGYDGVNDCYCGTDDDEDGGKSIFSFSYFLGNKYFKITFRKF